jgi:lactate dehydrogenase-like 2-hydroxyacid dehydrogenase
VFIEEPAGKENVLIQAANEDWAKGRLVLSPHLAWYAKSSMDKLRQTTTENVEAWRNGVEKNLVVRGIRNEGTMADGSG